MYRTDVAEGEAVTPKRSAAETFKEQQNLPIHRRGRFIKRSMDVAGAALVLVLFSWLFVAVWLAVRVTTGAPVIYKHRRIGLHGRSFECLKFRSMLKDSDRLLAEFLDSSPAAREEWARSFKLANDPRITAFGHFIRRTSLDELPQFWNVLVGDMSLVGPRPVTSKELETYYRTAEALYVSMRPGLTGLWQIGPRHEASYAARVALDVEYVRSWSICRDLSILWKTVAVVLSGRGAL